MRRSAAALAALAGLCLPLSAASQPAQPRQAGNASQNAAAPLAPQAMAALALPGPAGTLPTAADLDRPFDTPLPVRLRTAEGRQRGELRHCRDWLSQRASVSGSDNDAAWRVVTLQTVPCEALALLLAATPSAQTALPADRAVRPLLTARYPASLWPAPSDDEQRHQAQPGQSLARASGIQHWERLDAPGVADGERLGLRNRNWRVTLTLLARGDFDHDGWEDAAYLWQADSQRGSLSDARLVVLSRRGAEPGFRLLPVADLLAAAGWPGR